MIYFLINNDYHRLDFELHAPSLIDLGLHIVEIRHTLAEKECVWGKSSRFEPVLNEGVWRALVSQFQMARAIEQEIRPSSEDVLFVYTEFEPLNQLVVTLFRKARARVYLIEDGGIATYITFRNAVSEKLTLKELVLRTLYRWIPGAGNLRMQKIAGNVYPWMPDGSFDGLCLYRPLGIGRDIPVLALRRPAEPLVPNPNRQRILFLNQDLYAFSYLGTEDYLSILDSILASLSANFSEVLFKFHPRESATWRKSIADNVLCKFPNVICLQNGENIEVSLDELDVGLAASFNSTALMNLACRGVEPVFLYHLFPVLTRHADFRQNTEVLVEWGYAFADSLEAVNPGYRSGLQDIHLARGGRRTILEIIEGDR